MDGIVDDGDEDEEAFGGSLTAQLAETAVGVREMSKQLGTSTSLRSFTLRVFVDRPFRSSFDYGKQDAHEFFPPSSMS